MKEKKVKCGFTLPESLVFQLRELALKTKHGQSRIVAAVLEYGLPFYTIDGVVPPVKMGEPHDFSVEETPVVAEYREITVQQLTAEDLVPDPTKMQVPSNTQRVDHTLRSNTQLPSFVYQVAGSQPGPQPGASHTQAGQVEGYTPNFQPRGAEGRFDRPENYIPVNTPGVVDPSAIPSDGYIPMEPPAMTQEVIDRYTAIVNNWNAKKAAVSDAPQNQDLMAAVQQIMRQMQQPASGQGFTPMPPPPPPTPVNFAASYPPGYTGPPGVMPVANPQREQPMYPVPQPLPTQNTIMRDPYAMNIGLGSNPLTAQTLLSGGPMAPNLAGPNTNVNMLAAQTALGPNWRQHLRQVSAQDRRG